jgi:hypothetical protein
MLHHPLELPKYMMTIAEIQEERGNLTGAIQTCRDLLAEMKGRRVKMRENDRRICDESGKEEERKSCRDAIEAWQPIVGKDEVRAQETIVRLQAQLQQAKASGTRGTP